MLNANSHTLSKEKMIKTTLRQFNLIVHFTYLCLSSEDASMSLNSPEMWTIPQHVTTNANNVCNTIWKHKINI